MTKEGIEVLEIAIWGIAIMLVVKALDIMHQEALAQSHGRGALLPAIVGSVVALGGAVFLVIASNQQTEGLDSPPFAVGQGVTSKEVDASIAEAEATMNRIEREYNLNLGNTN